MKAYILFITSFFVLIDARSQSIRIETMSFSVNAAYNWYKVDLTCNRQGWLQEDFLVYYIDDSTNSPVPLFKTWFYNNCIHSEVVWYNDEGEVIERMIPGNMSCTVHASKHQFVLPGNIELTCSALIDSWTVYNQRYPSLPRIEKEYRDGELYKKRIFHSNGQLKSEDYYLPNRHRSFYEMNDPTTRYMLNGTHKVYNERGILLESGMYDYGRPFGVWEFFSSDGILTKQVVYNKPDSLTITEYYPNGNLKKSSCQNNSSTIGTYREFYESGKLKYQTHYGSWGNRDSIEVVYYENGNPQMIKPCCDYTMTGVYQSWFENGKPFERIEYLDGLREGLYQKWFENGKLNKEGGYQNDRAVGVWKIGDESGRISRIKSEEMPPEEVELASAEIFDDLIVMPPPVQRLDEFKIEPPQDSFSNTVFKLEDYKELQFLRRYDFVDIEFNLDDQGKIVSSQLITPLKKSEEKKLSSFLDRTVSFTTGFKVLWNSFSCKAVVRIGLKEY